MTQKTEKILESNLFQLMFHLTLPAVLSTLLFGIQNFIDAIFAGQFLGGSAFAAISMTYPITFIISGLAKLIGGGSASIFSRAIGARDNITKRKVLNNLFLLTLVTSVICTFIGYIFSDRLIILIGGTNEIFQQASSYLKVIFLGSIFLISGMAGNMLIHSEGKIRLATFYIAIAVFTNIIGNIFFVKVLNLEITGIAYATLISMLVFSFLNFRYVVKTQRFNISLSFLLKGDNWSSQLIKKIVLIGIPGLLFNILALFQHSLIYKTVALNGTDRDLILMAASLRIFILTTNIASAFAIGFAPVAGINYGARNYSRVKKSLILFSVSGGFVLMFIWLYMQLYSQTFVGFFLPSFSLTEQDILRFKIIIFLIPIFPFAFCNIKLFQAIGNGILPAFFLISRQILLLIPILYFCQKIFGITGIYLSLLIVDIIVVLVSVFFTRVEFKKMSQS